MTEREMYLMYREARNQNEQIQILAELNGLNRNEIIRILVKNSEKLPSRVINQLYKRLDVLEAQISEREKEYREIVQALNVNGSRKYTQGQQALIDGVEHAMDWGLDLNPEDVKEYHRLTDGRNDGAQEWLKKCMTCVHAYTTKDNDLEIKCRCRNGHCNYKRYEKH